LPDSHASPTERFWESAWRRAKARVSALSRQLDERDSILDIYKDRKCDKSKGQYTGPGVCKVAFRASDNTLRFVVAHELKYGQGELYHIYSEREITWWPEPAPVATELPLFESRQ
jgi:hypothetical protein